MSGFPSKPASSQSNIFNPSFYQSDGDFITLGTAESLFCKLNDYRLSKAAISISQSDADSRYIQIGGALTQTQGDARYQRLAQQFAFSSSVENFLSSGATSGTNYGIVLNHNLDNSNSVYTSNAIAFSRNNVVGSAIALQRDVSGANQISLFLNSSGIMESRYRFNRISFESQSLIVSESTRTLSGVSVSGLLFNSNVSPNWLRRIQTSTRFTMLGHITGGILVDAVQYDISSTSLITFNMQATQLRLNTSSTTGQISLVADGSVQDGATYDRVLRFVGRGSAIQSDFKILINNQGDAANGSKPTWIGSTTNEFRLGANDTTRITITRDGYVGINTTTPICSLDVAAVSGGNITVGPGGTSYAWASRTSYASYVGGYTVSPACARFQGDVVCNSVYTTSDRRMKEHIEAFRFQFMSEFYDGLKPCTFKYKSQTGNARKLGFIAQELLVSSSVPLELLTFQKDEKMKAQSNDDIAGFQLGIDYSAMSVLNAIAIKEILSEIKKLMARLEFSVL